MKICADAEPDPSWGLLAELPIDEDLASLERWLVEAFTRHPPAADIPGLWFGLETIARDGSETLELSVSGGQSGGELPEGLVIGGAWEPQAKHARSAVLDRIYAVSHADEDSPLADVEPSISLAYAALAIQSVVQGLDPQILLAGATQRTLGVGYHDGDFVGIGALTTAGPTLSPA